MCDYILGPLNPKNLINLAQDLGIDFTAGSRKSRADVCRQRPRIVGKGLGPRVFGSVAGDLETRKPIPAFRTGLASGWRNPKLRVLIEGILTPTDLHPIF